MSGWRPSFSVCGMAVVCTAAVLPSAVVWLVPYSSHCSAGEYCSSCRALFFARCCGVWVVGVCLCCSCGGVSSVRSPLVVVVGGAIVDGGVLSWMVGGMVSEGRQCYWPPCRMSVSPSVCWRPPCRLPCGLIEWRGVACAVMPCLRIGPAPCIVSLPFTLSVPFVSFPFLFCLVLLCLLWVGKCGGGTVSRFPLLLPTVCVLCHSIVGLGLCLCDRVMSLRNGGDGLCWVEGRVAPTVHCRLCVL